MATICLVSCVSSKRQESTPAEDMYISPLFGGARLFAKSRFDKWYILSAKYGLLEPHQPIAPYEKTLKSLSKTERLRWAEKVFADLSRHVTAGDRVAFVAGLEYREFLIPKLEQLNVNVTVPLQGMSIGKQLQWLNKLRNEKVRHAHLDEFYELLAELEEGLGGKRKMRECQGQMRWPAMGVYFFFEPFEMRTSKPWFGRVTRVGTHTVSKGSKTTLWQRLRTHRGAGDLSGNHRGSIFRLHVGAALLARCSGSSKPATWGIGQTATPETREAELAIEEQVSRYIGEMSLLWLAVGDEPSASSDRSYIERHSIGLLAGPSGPLDVASPSWLGRASARAAIRRSGLWNVNYVDDRYDADFLSVLREYVAVTLGSRVPPKSSLAPRGWSASLNDNNRRQLPLFQEGGVK